MYVLFDLSVFGAEPLSFQQISPRLHKIALLVIGKASQRVTSDLKRLNLEALSAVHGHAIVELKGVASKREG